MNVYTEPVIDELLHLYHTGVDAIDVSARYGRESFNLKAALIWTMHDWPGIL